MIKFTIDGEPCGKGRPKFSHKSGTAYTPDKTARYEDRVRWDYKMQTNGAFLNGQLVIHIYAYFKMPKASKINTMRMLNGTIRPTKKPDWDNIGKIICDALNDIAYHDDSQIVSAHVNKYFSEKPRVEVVIVEMEDMK